MTKSSNFIGIFFTFALLLVAGFAFWQREQEMLQVKTLPSPSQTRSEPTLQPAPSSIAEPSTDPTTTWRTYRNEKYGFKVKYPPEWSVLKLDNSEFEAAYRQNILAVEVFEFYSASFQNWVNERPYALTKFHGRDALRWSTRGYPTPIHQAYRQPGTEELLIPSAKKDFAIFIQMSMEDIGDCRDCVRVFEQVAESLVF